MGTIPEVRLDEYKDLLPEQIVTDDEFSRHGYGESNEREAEKIDELAATIERDGQLDAGIVVPRIVTTKGECHEEYVLIAGHRRKQAIALNNDKRSASGKPLLKMRVRIDRSGLDPFRKSIVSNLHRADLSPMDRAVLMQRVRDKFKWEGFAGAKRVAQYLGVDVATVTQHEKFLTAEPEIRDKLHSGQITAQEAHDLLNVKPEKRHEKLERAAEIQLESDPASAVMVKRRTENGTVTDVEPRHIKRPALMQAIREDPDAIEQPIPLNRKDLIESVSQLDGPAYGYTDGPIRQWARYWAEVYAAGKGTERTMLAKFDAMIEKAQRGTKPKDEKPEKIEKPVEKKALPKRLPRKDKKEKKQKKAAKS